MIRAVPALPATRLVAIWLVGGLVYSAGACLATVSAAAAPEMSAADILAERLLWAVGGRPSWSAVTNTIAYTQQYRPDQPADVGAVITMDYPQRRYRIDTTGPHLQLIRSITVGSDRNWRLDAHGRPEKTSEDAFAQDLHRYTVHIYQTLHRMAARDPALKLAIGRKGSLEVYEDGKRIAWYQLDARGEPYLIGAFDDNVGVLYGPWDVERVGIRYPAWLSRPDGSWRATFKSLAVNTPLSEELFTQPVGAER